MLNGIRAEVASSYLKGENYLIFRGSAKPLALIGHFTSKVIRELEWEVR